MKRLGSSDSLAGLISICPNSEEQSPKNTHVYSREFQTMLDGLDEEGCIEELGHISEKKRRLSVEQVKALEKNFEVENKLEPDRKVKLAQELGLQPRQVAVWFQNRRARWKTKQLERDYGVLKANYDNLKLNFDSLQHDNESLLKEIKELKGKLSKDNRESSLRVKGEIISEAGTRANDQNEPHFTPTIDAASDSKDMDYNSFDDDNGAVLLIFPDLKDGSSDDSDSSAILNEDPSPNAANSSSGIFQNHNHLVISPTSSSIRFNCSSSVSNSSTNYFQFSDSKTVSNNALKTYHHQPQSSVKIEEHNFFSGEEACNFFSDEQAPSLHWYCPDQWN